MNAQLVLDVFAELVDYIVTHGESPSVRDLCIATGWSGEKEIWWSLQILEDVGAIKWDIDPSTGKRADRGIELLVRLKQPVKVPIVGYLNIPSDFVPGSRWIEFYEDGRIIVNEGERTWEAILIKVM
jgi:hypothetical protein